MYAQCAHTSQVKFENKIRYGSREIYQLNIQFCAVTDDDDVVDTKVAAAASAAAAILS